MKAFAFPIYSVFVVSAQAQLLPFSFFANKPSPAGLAQHPQQEPMDANAPGIQLPPSSTDGVPQETGAPPGDVILSDIIGNQRSINIFAGFTRDVTTVSTRLENADLNTTILAPANSAMHDLPRKPWEDPEDYAALGESAYDGRAGEDRANRNLRRFTEAHIIPVAPWKEGDKVKSMGGQELWWERKDGRAVVQPGGVVVEKVTSKVANGEVWMLERVLNYAS